MNKTLIGIVIGLLVIIVALQGYSLFRNGEEVAEVATSTPTSVPNTKPTTAPVDNTGNSNLQTYRDSENGFDLSYDGSVFKKEIKDGYISVPPATGQRKVSQMTLVRYASRPMYNWGTGFKTQDRTDNPRIRIGVTPVAYPIYEAYVYETFDKLSVESVIIAGRKGIRYWMGAEGDGVAIYCIPLNEKKTLCMEYNTLDGESLRVYRDVPDFIPLSQQRTLAESVINTVKFIK